MIMSNLIIPRKVGDKFKPNRFHKENTYQQTFTVSGFYISFWDRSSNIFSKLSSLLKTKKASINENMEKSLLEAKFKQSEIRVK